MASATLALQQTDRSISRLLAQAFPDAERVEGDQPLETSSTIIDPPKLVSAMVIEGDVLRAIPVSGPPVVAFAAFLDGRQHGAVHSYRSGGVPIAIGTIGAAIRERRESRMFTWKHRVDHRVYAPRTYLSESDWRVLEGLGVRLRDTTEGKKDAIEHPLALRELALNAVRNDRESLELELADRWCAAETRPLLIDGGIGNARSIADSRLAVGVVKSHMTLYAQGEALRRTLALEAGERTSVFRIAPEKRAPVASWYLRLRDRQGRDPMWGLVRVEISVPAGGAPEIAARADDVSRWILAEVSPVALPDGRWDKMVYGVRDCEEFLRAVM